MGQERSVSRRWRVLILGGNRYNVPSIDAARRAGFVALVADRNPDAPGLNAADVGLAIDIVDVDALMEAIQGHGGVDGIVSTAEVGVQPAAELSARLGLPSITREAASRATSKALMRRHWADLGGFSTDFAVVRTEEEACRAVAELGGFPLIVKPDRSFGGSRGVSRARRIDQLHEAFAFATARGLPGTQVVIERFLVGSEHSCEVLIDGDETSVLCIGQKVKSRYPYRVDASVQYPAPLSPQQEEGVGDMCHRAIAALGLTRGVAHIEFVHTERGPVLMELGARCGGGHTPIIARHVSGVDEFVEYCRLACGLRPERFVPRARRGADYRFLVFPPGRLAEICIPEEVREHPAVFDVDITLQPDDEIHPLRTTADRAGFAVVLGSTLEEVTELADWVCRTVTVTYVDGSTAHAYTLTSFLESV